MRGAKTEEKIKEKIIMKDLSAIPKRGQISEGMSFNGKVRLSGSTRRSFRVP